MKKSRWKAKIILFCVFICATSQSFATGQAKKKVLSLKDAILLSLRLSPNVESAELQRVVDKFSVALAKNQFEFRYALTGSAVTSTSVTSGQTEQISKNFNLTPTITKETVYGTQYSITMTNPVTYNNTVGGSPQPYYYNPTLSMQLTHPLLQGSGRTIAQANLNSALINNEIAKLNFKNAMITQVTQIITDYRAVVSAENALIVDKAALKASRDTVKNNKVKIKLGLLAASENTQAEVQVASQELQVASDINAIRQTRLVLFKDIGMQPDNELVIDTKISMDNTSYPKGEQASQLLFNNNISYLSTQLALKIGKLSLLLAEDQQRWVLNLVGNISQGGNDNEGIRGIFNGLNKSRTLGLELTVPIDNMSAQQAVVSAQVGYSQQKLAAQQLKLTLNSQLNGSLFNLSILKSQIGIAEQQEALANQSYKDASTKFLLGKTSMFEVTTLQNSLISAQLSTINNKISYLNSIAAFHQFLGTTLDEWKIKLVY